MRKSYIFRCEHYHTIMILVLFTRNLQYTNYYRQESTVTTLFLTGSLFYGKPVTKRRTSTFPSRLDIGGKNGSVSVLSGTIQLFEIKTYGLLFKNKLRNPYNTPFFSHRKKENQEGDNLSF